jgi:hypothetical protein
MTETPADHGPSCSETHHPVSVSTNPKDWVVIFQQCLANTAAAATGDVDSSLYESETEREACRNLFEALDDDLKVHAANTSYAYWYLTTQLGSDHEEFIATEDDKLYAGMKEARRHYVSMHRNFEKALKNLTESCAFRKVRNNYRLLLSEFWTSSDV